MKTQKMTTKEAMWVTGFMGITGTAIAMELVAARRNHPEMAPWTGLLVRYIPKPVTLAAAGYLSAWLVPHFLRAYKKAGK